jgi:diguanylate cyclase (GGDEF)-like protein/PAS domain S-box-containing protein
LTNNTEILPKRPDQVNQALEFLLHSFSAYALPVVIGLLSLLSLFVWKSQYGAVEPQQLEIQVLKTGSPIATPQEAAALLQNAATVQYVDTELSEAPYWLAFTPKGSASGKPLSVEFPSRHTAKLSCWGGPGLLPLGSASQTQVSGDLRKVKSGFELTLATGVLNHPVVCCVESVGPARISTSLWASEDLQTSTQEFHRKSGLLDGGILILAVFVLITALINRNGLYLIFAAWLVVNLRMGALSAGWDTQWLGNDVPAEWLLRMRLVTTAIYYVLSITLFGTLFSEDLTKVRALLLLRIAQWSCVPLLILSFFLSYQSYLPFLWVSTGLSIALMVLALTIILSKSRSQVALWYTASIAITIAASLVEVLAAALGIKGLIGSFNSVTAALSSSLLAALAIAAQMRQEHTQRLAVQAELQHTYEAMPIGLFTLDLRGRFVSANPALLRMLGPKVLENGGHTWQRYFVGGAWSQLHNMLLSQKEGELELRGRSQLFEGGEVSRFLVKATLAGDRVEGSLQNITEKAKATEELLFLVNNDPLTKVLNRRGIEKALDHAMSELALGKPLTLAYLDLDRFRLINDLYGHNAGDEVLQQVCQRVTHMISGAIQFGRVGGDEFVLVMSDTKIPVASLICRGIIDSLGSSPYRVGDRAFHVRGSIGLIEVGAEMQVKDAVSTADRACHDAKAGSGDGLVVYERNASAFDQHDAELKLVEQLSTSSATDGLFVVMQPIMSLSSPHASLNFEVLLRMLDVDGKPIPTDRLIAAGEKSGRMSVIDRWVLQTTLAWLNQNQERLKHTRFVCMNLSGASLNDEKFLQDVYTMLEQNVNVVRHLCLEITESVALHDLNNTRRFVDRVRSFGAKVALDDFGAGYTSFSYLKELTADLLKIDGSFIVNMNRHPANVAIVEAIVSLARNLGMKTIAEWAEDAATVQTLIEIGVDYVQGYVIARPQHPDALLAVASSASFIVDQDLIAVVSLLGQPEDRIAQVDLFEASNMAALH